MEIPELNKKKNLPGWLEKNKQILVPAAKRIIEQLEKSNS